MELNLERVDKKNKKGDNSLTFHVSKYSTKI